ncbi:metallothionein expression activator [Echria macrotheca]|uniref:Metallothionein expression activator n=1 Tax=Echria macrotheca TaxID=438768 RepID=A0AAJ0B7G5_9PEZI|nr:metallothionein expression activator [Echria macrotheca]
MLPKSPPPSSLQARQRQHRRQNSTPSAFEAAKIAPLPNFQQQRPHVSHRRGLSLDTRRQQFSPTRPTPTLRQDYTTVSTSTTNQGPAPQHVLREAQQHRIVRPGPGQPNFDPSQPQQDRSSDAFLLTTHTTPHGSHFMDAMSSQGQMADMNTIALDYMSSMNAMLSKNQASFANNNAMSTHQDFDMFGPDSALSTPTFMTFPEQSPAGTGQGWISESETASTHTRRTSRRISGGIMDKVAKFEALGGNSMGPRPVTPPLQNANNCFPPQTPHDRNVKHEPASQPQLNRFSDDYDESMEETIKPIRANQSNRNSGIFQDLRQQAEAMVQTPQRANTMPMSFEQALGTPGFMNMTNVSAEFAKIENTFDGMHSSFHSDLSATQSPMTSGMSSFVHNPFDQRPDFPPPSEFDSQNTVIPHGHASSQGPSRRGSPHRRTESTASIVSAASIADINIEETKTDTGVTQDDIAAYIDGPDPADGKWICTFEKCLKRFGRKENIKSHVQTHLNDRQYQCPSCAKCFVRQHDLKRHAKIHTGIKPYPCDCGNTFARHDALTRHRQRGMCIGAFEGIKRKEIKRGRPRKHERREKKEQTRRKNKHTSTESVSSFSGYSANSSAINSPVANNVNSFDSLVDDDTDPFQDFLADRHHSLPTISATMNPSNLTVSSAPMPSSSLSEDCVADGTSPMDRVVSPSAISEHEHADLMAAYDLPRRETTQPSSPPKSIASNSPGDPTSPLPGLSHCSSPHALANSTRFTDSTDSIGPGDSYNRRLSAVSMSIPGPPSLVTAGNDGGPTLAGMDDSGLSLLQFPPDDDVLFHPSVAGMGGGLYGMGGGGGKNGDDLGEYDAAVNMFTNEDDVFFEGSRGEHDDFL